MMEVLASGLLGAVLVFLMQIGFATKERARRIRGNWEALYVEVRECGGIAREYINELVLAPSYRLPTICYETCLPSLLSDVALNQDDADALLKFYAEVQTLNRGLDLADIARRTSDRVQKDDEYRRNCLKAERIKQPDGLLYSQAISVCERRKAEPGIAILTRRQPHGRLP